MFFILSKVVYWVFMPMGLISISFLTGLLIKKDKHKKFLFTIGIALLFLFTNPFLANLTMMVWEPSAKEYSAITEQYEYAIVLTGITEPNRFPQDRIQFNKGADRIVHAIEMYKMGIAKKILITGGSATISFKGQKESNKLRDFALMCGVALADLLIEDMARNTKENAELTATLLGKNRNGKHILVTSAFHMRRAKKCFEKINFDVDTFPTDYYAEKFRYTPDEFIVPSTYSLKLWEILFREWLGIIAYKMVGYI